MTEVIGAIAAVVHVANLRALVSSPPEPMSWVDGSASAELKPWPAGDRALAADPVDPEVGDPLVDDLPPGHPGQPEAFMEVSFGGDRAWKLSSEPIRSSRTSRSCRYFGDALAGPVRRPPGVASAFLTPSPRLDKLLGWLVIRLDRTPWRVNGWERGARWQMPAPRGPDAAEPTCLACTSTRRSSHSGAKASTIRHV